MPLKLSTFSANQKITTPEGNATGPFLRWINDAVKSIQSSVNDIGQLVADIAFSLQQAGIAITTANEAKAAAAAATAAATDAAAGAAAVGVLVNSYVVEANVISAAIDADTAAASISVSQHTRMYGDGTSVLVNGGTIMGLVAATQYYVSYLDPQHLGGAVSYEITTNPSEAGQTGDRHLVGGYAMPSANGSGGGGGTTRPPGIPSWKFPDNVNIE
ncbi:hypothetical protein [Sphingomonas aerolata]|uniref:hypothetical protein n=1 Tax=Sphingomonas aerolata TaxID=185951 RepID=UPI002FE38E6E